MNFNLNPNLSQKIAYTFLAMATIIVIVPVLTVIFIIVKIRNT